MDCPATIVIDGAGDIGSAVAVFAFRQGCRVVIRDEAQPAWTRRGMAFMDAFFDGAAELCGVTARFVPALFDDAIAPDAAIIATTAPASQALAATGARVLVDARMQKRASPPDRRSLGAFVIGLGPGFVAGGNADIAVETSWEGLGRIIRQGSTKPFAGEPRALGGLARERYVYALAAGVFQTTCSIGEKVAAGQHVAQIADRVLVAPVDGVLRGLTRSGVPVRETAKVIEVDPRGDPATCFGIGERPGAIAASVIRVLEADLGLPLLSDGAARETRPPKSSGGAVS